MTPYPHTDAPVGNITQSRLDNMIGGWFVGAFQPASYNTSDVEVAVQAFPAGYKGEYHYHRQATEITLLLSGRAWMAGRLLFPGDILTLEPGTPSSFVALEDCRTVVVKHPGVLNDKFLVGETTC
ncbi:cupin domain-containing protein [Klebsiella aerogenes]|nr:cupin domain-containing protein [Klebsiella aerogenes]HEO1675219.1 cupin domain-containing protein [Klebsiella aerogenes]